MSGRIFQTVLSQLKEASGKTIGVTDNTGSIIACSDSSFIGTTIAGCVPALAEAAGGFVRLQGLTMKALPSSGPLFENAVFVRGDDGDAAMVCQLSSVALAGAKSYFEEKYDKSAFLKSIITENIMPGEIYVRARELNFLTDVFRAVFLFRRSLGADAGIADIIAENFSDKNTDFVLNISEDDVVLVKQLEEELEGSELIANAEEMLAALTEAGIEGVVVGIGTVAHSLREVAASYKEAQMAIQVGQVFDFEKTITTYENLGIGRLIYQLPTTLCEMFLDEVFKKNTIDSLDQETLFTINKFFENNLNVSEASRKLFVHRNTLVYRLEKIKKLTGLDLREFDHAIIFKMALMVKKYLDSKYV
ncbi:MAG: helix-turn-helix domain-containing protein [Oscillospiraceae bacterium]|nr:helix-turn-helix domain-containing protein [Oscillospiraceae bacterium]